MSRRVTTQTKMTNIAHVRSACKQQGIPLSEHGDSVHFTDGPMRGATLNLRTGEVSGDSDYGHTTQSLGALKQAYGEAVYRAELQLQGGVVESRHVMENGIVRLRCALG